MKHLSAILVLLTSTICSYAQLPSVAEYNSLIDLYNSTNGANWINNTGWSTANPNIVQSVSAWYGVRTNSEGHVTDIDFDGVADFTTITNSSGFQVYTGNNLNGTLPTTIGSLTHLITLNLGGNQLTGSLPDQIGQLTNLVWLIGSTNQFTGSLPSSIGNLTKLDRIFMEKNQLTGIIPPGIGNMPDLWALLLNDNQLSGPIPDSLGNCKKLRFFYLHHNQLTGSIPEELGTITGAYRMGFGDNQLTGSIPASFANLSGLQVLSLPNNNLTGLVPPGLSNIASLTWVDISNNKFNFSNAIEFASSFTKSLLFYPQQRVDEEKTTNGSIEGSITLTTSIERNTIPPSSYSWYKEVDGKHIELNIHSTSGHTITLSDLTAEDGQASYYYRISNPVVPGNLESHRQYLALGSGPLSSDVNFIRSIDVTVAGKTEPAHVENATVVERTINFTYFDGLGRPMQQVAQQGSPTKRDVITPIVYDEYGREARKYLPFVVGSTGIYRSNGQIIDGNHNYVGIAESTYSNEGDKIADDPRPYSQIIFEPSPLTRPDKEYGPGQAWAPDQIDGNKFIQHQYLSNVHSLNEDPNAEAIIAWTVDESGMLVKEEPVTNYIAAGGYYESNQLFIKVTLDEHQNAVREYTNKQGQVILKKVQAVAKSNPLEINLNNFEEWACTYYVYDDLGNLRYVLPPEGVKQYLELTSQN